MQQANSFSGIELCLLKGNHNVVPVQRIIPFCFLLGRAKGNEENGSLCSSFSSDIAFAFFMRSLSRNHFSRFIFRYFSASALAAAASSAFILAPSRSASCFCLTAPGSNNAALSAFFCSISFFMSR
jgi:hypothetical protein